MSRRNNQDRVGAPHPDSEPPPAAVDKGQDDFLSFVTPTEFVELPSGGQHYAEDSPLYKAESIELRHMTAKEEDILTSQSLLRKGLVIDRLLESLLVDRRIRVDDLLIGDKNALLVAARKTGFGNLYITNVACPQCSVVSEQEFDLDTVELDEACHRLPEEVTDQGGGIYALTIPGLKVRVEVRLLTSADEMRLVAAKERKRKLKLPESNYTDNLKSIIVSVEGRQDAASVDKLLEVMPLRDAAHIMKIYQKVVPSVNSEQLFSCDSCSFEGGMELPFTADFFWPDT